MPESTEQPILVWFRNDLRIEDQPALHAAAQTGQPVIPIYIWNPQSEAPWQPGGASRWWLHASLQELSTRIEACGSQLTLCIGSSLESLEKAVKETGATAVYWNRRYEPAALKQDREIEEALSEDGVEVRSFNSALLAEPETISNKAGKPLQVFTPMYKHYLATVEPEVPLPAPKTLPAPNSWPYSVSLDALALEPVPDWAGGLRENWMPGEVGAWAVLEGFFDDAAADYPDRRDRPGIPGTSRISPHLHIGEISPRSVWHACQEAGAMDDRGGLYRGIEAWLRQLVWREFAHHLLFHFPHTPTEPLRPEYADFPWLEDDKGLRAWQKGRTGYRIVDAGMQELWVTGWMHNRVRMIVASFLVKDLLIPWQHGARWFWDTLVDADLANNTLGWQWTAGCGADAAPYFRIFNPILQGKKFDPDGDYVRHWLPQLKELPNKYIHCPWEAPEEALAAAGVHLGENYPKPMVDHKMGRDRALEALSAIKRP